MNGDLLVDDAGPVAVISFNRPEARNALTRGMLRELTSTLQRCGDRTDLRAVVLRGYGEQPFSSGYNLDELPSHALTSDDARKIHAPVLAVAEAIRACPHPVIGAARKYIFGAALDIFAHCDLRLCAVGTTFCMPPNRLGFLYPDEGMRRLSEVIGLSRATHMLLLGAPISTEQAVAWGLVHQTFAADAFEAGVHAFCAEVAANAPLSMRATKQVLQTLQGQSSVPSAASDEAMYVRIAACLNSSDVREAVKAFAEKRAPVFHGR